MHKERAFTGRKGWRRALSVRLAPFVLLLFASFLLDCIPSPALAAPAALSLDQGDGGEDGEPLYPILTGEGRDNESEGLDPYSLGLRQTYLNHLRFRGTAGKSRPQIDDFGDPRWFEARGPPVTQL